MALLLCSAFLFLCDNVNARLKQFSISLFSCRGVSIFKYCDSEKGSKLLSFVCLDVACASCHAVGDAAVGLSTVLENYKTEHKKK